MIMRSPVHCNVCCKRSEGLINCQSIIFISLCCRNPPPPPCCPRHEAAAGVATEMTGPANQPPPAHLDTSRHQPAPAPHTAALRGLAILLPILITKISPFHLSVASNNMARVDIGNQMLVKKICLCLK